MNPRRASLDYLRDMLDAAAKAEEFTRGMDAASFAADTKTVYAVVRALEVVGGAAKKVPATVQQQYAFLPWRAMAGMPVKLTHDYVGVNLEVVWHTVQDDLPAVRSSLRRIIAELEQAGEP